MRDDVLIIDAGLAAAYELRHNAVRVRLIDQAERVASSCRRRHDQFCLNTHHWFSHQSGRRIPHRLGSVPARDDYVACLEDYVERSGLPIEFGQSARRIDRHPAGGWRASTDKGTLQARHIIVSTGSDRPPWTLPWPGLERYRGTVVHAGEFRHAPDYAGKRVLDERGHPRWLADRASPAHPGLWFFGRNSSTYGNMTIRRAEARRLAKKIRAELACTDRAASRRAVMQTPKEDKS